MMCCRWKFKPACSVGDLLTQYLVELDKEAERKGWVLQALSDPFSRVYKMSVLAAEGTFLLWSDGASQMPCCSTRLLFARQT
jgi:hypothetical protein